MTKALFTASLVAVAMAWAFLAQTALAADARHYVAAGSPAAGVESCVEPTELMRRKHMEFIKHQRDATVHSGIRATRYSLAGCVECHVSYDDRRNPQPIHGRDQFCGACHSFAAVHLNCFDCHAAVPNGTVATDGKALADAAGQ